MQIWTSSDAMLDIDDPLNSARKDVERELNVSVGCEDYGSGVSKWAVIYIVMDKDDPAYPEVRRYNNHTGVVELRLKVDHHAFKESNSLAHRKLLAVAMLRSIDLSEGLKLGDFDTGRFRKDVVQGLKKNEWV